MHLAKRNYFNMEMPNLAKRDFCSRAMPGLGNSAPARGFSR